MNEEKGSILHNLGDAVIRTEESIIKYANKAAGKLLECDENELLGKDLLDVVKESYKDIVKRNYERLEEENEIHPYEVELIREGGSVTGEIGMRRMKHEGRSFEILVIRDIDARKRREEVFWEQEERFQAVADNTPDIIARFDEEGRYVYVNKTAEEVYGIPKKDFFWKTDEDLGINKERKEVFRETITLVFKTQEKKTFYSETVIGGERKYFYTILVPEFLKDGVMNSVLSITRDITEIREIDKVKSEFISITSHQLRSPLATINWCILSLLQEEANGITSQQEEYLEQIHGATRNLIKITDVFLNTTMLDLEMFVLNPERFDLLDFTKEVKKEFEKRIKEKELNFSETHDDSISYIRMDKKVLKIILRGLISNAIEYTPKKGKIHFATKKGDGRIVLELGDSGCGIPPEEKKRIFTKFYRTEEARKMKAYGTGLDLYLIKSLLDKIGGNIRAESPNPEFGKGTVFYVEFPVAWENT